MKNSLYIRTPQHLLFHYGNGVIDIDMTHTTAFDFFNEDCAYVAYPFITSEFALLLLVVFPEAYVSKMHYFLIIASVNSSDIRIMNLTEYLEGDFVFCVEVGNTDLSLYAIDASMWYNKTLLNNVNIHDYTNVYNIKLATGEVSYFGFCKLLVDKNKRFTPLIITSEKKPIGTDYYLDSIFKKQVIQKLSRYHDIITMTTFWKHCRTRCPICCTPNTFLLPVFTIIDIIYTPPRVTIIGKIHVHVDGKIISPMLHINVLNYNRIDFSTLELLARDDIFSYYIRTDIEYSSLQPFKIAFSPSLKKVLFLNWKYDAAIMIPNILPIYDTAYCDGYVFQCSGNDEASYWNVDVVMPKYLQFIYLDYILVQKRAINSYAFDPKKRLLPSRKGFIPLSSPDDVFIHYSELVDSFNNIHFFINSETGSLFSFKYSYERLMNVLGKADFEFSK